MKSLSKAEEQVLYIIWTKEPTYLKDILASYPEPRPAKTTLATVLKRIKDKGYITYDQEGKSRCYRSTVPKTKYLQHKITNLISRFFENSPTQFASFFTQEMELSEDEINQIKDQINAQKDT